MTTASSVEVSMERRPWVFWVSHGLQGFSPLRPAPRLVIGRTKGGWRSSVCHRNISIVVLLYVDACILLLQCIPVGGPIAFAQGGCVLLLHQRDKGARLADVARLLLLESPWPPQRQLRAALVTPQKYLSRLRLRVVVKAS